MWCIACPTMMCFVRFWWLMRYCFWAVLHSRWKFCNCSRALITSGAKVSFVFKKKKNNNPQEYILSFSISQPTFQDVQKDFFLKKCADNGYKCNKRMRHWIHWFTTREQSQMRYARGLLIVIKMQHCCSVTSVQLLTSAHQTARHPHTLACNSLSWGTVAIIFVAITLIRGKHTDGVVSQTHGLRIKMSSLPKLVMVWETNPK